MILFIPPATGESQTMAARSVHLTVWPPEKIRRGAVCEVSVPGAGVAPVENSLSDARMGPTFSRDQKCATCGETGADCPGHFGCMTLALPVFNVLFLDHVVRLLKSVAGEKVARRSAHEVEIGGARVSPADVIERLVDGQ